MSYLHFAGLFVVFTVPYGDELSVILYSALPHHQVV